MFGFEFWETGMFSKEFLDKLLYNRYTCINEQYLFMFPHPIPPTPFRPPKGGYVGEQGHCILFFKTRKLRS